MDWRDPWGLNPGDQRSDEARHQIAFFDNLRIIRRYLESTVIGFREENVQVQNVSVHHYHYHYHYHSDGRRPDRRSLPLHFLCARVDLSPSLRHRTLFQ